MTGGRSFTYDAAMNLKDKGLVAASAYATVGGAVRTINLGPNVPFLGLTLIDVSSIEIASNDEAYRIMIVGSDTEDFSGTREILAELTLGATEVRPLNAADSTIGRYELPFSNVRDNRNFQFIRLYTLVSGTVATGISFGAYIGRLAAIAA